MTTYEIIELIRRRADNLNKLAADSKASKLRRSNAQNASEVLIALANDIEAIASGR